MSIDIIKETDFTLRKTWNRRYPTEAITDKDDADDLALLVNTPAQTESLLQYLEKAAEVIGI